MTHLITGVAGFIGSNLASKLLSKSIKVIGIDNFHLGSKQNLDKFINDPNFVFLNYDLSNIDKIQELENKLINQKISHIWHLAANSDIQAGTKNSFVDLKFTFMTSYVAIELCKKLNIDNFIFASTSAVYGDYPGKLSEVTPLLPISNYGAMKLASEAIIGAAIEQGLKKAFIFRFPNVVGSPATHGVIYDFINKLKNTPDKLDVLGNGTQKKCYLHVSELLNAMLFCIETIKNEGSHCFNLGPLDSGITVKKIAEKVSDKISPQAEIFYGKENKGWVGDVPNFEFDISKIAELGWTPSLNSDEAIDLAITEIKKQLL